MRGKVRSRQRNGWIAALAARQHGVISRRQLLDGGLSRHTIDRLLLGGWLAQIHRGVYAVGPSRLTTRGRCMAAVIAIGDGAIVSHQDGAALWGLGMAHGRETNITVGRKISARRGAIRVHFSRLPGDEMAVRDAIPVTSVPRTLLDLAAELPRHRLERILEEAEYQRLFDRLSLADLVNRYPGRRGLSSVRGILADRAIGTGISRSELEVRFLAFLDQHGLRRPETNVRIELRPGEWVEVDCLWRRERVVVELDGRAAHETADAFEEDRARDRALHVAGWLPVRITWRQLHLDARALSADLGSLLDTEVRPR